MGFIWPLCQLNRPIPSCEVGVNLSATDDNGRTPAHSAASFGKAGALKELVEAGAAL